jgi:carboxyvinyl-carboxyphosphonate phosphorylmutase
MAGYKAVHDTLKALREGTAPKDLAGVPSADFMRRVTRGDDYARWTRDFLGGE